MQPRGFEFGLPGRHRFCTRRCNKPHGRPVKIHQSAQNSTSTRRCMPAMIRDAVESDREALALLARDTGLFPTPEELAEFKDNLESFFASKDSSDEAWLVYMREDRLAGAAYFAPDGTHYPSPHQGDGVWNIYFIGVQPDLQRHGIGSLLLGEVESRLAGRQGKLLIIETSGKGSFESIRAFYIKHGYDAGDVTPDFYGAGDDKVIFLKQL